MAGEAIIITGGGGFVGRHLLTELQRAQPESRLLVWDRAVTTLPVDVEGVAVDIADPQSYRASLTTVQPAWIIHLAAVASAAQARADTSLAQRINVEGTRQLLNTVREVSPTTRVLAISTADIYGQGSATPLPELSLEAAAPTNPYAQTKWEMEQMIEADFNDLTIRVRPFPHIGPGQAPGYVTADFASQIAAIEAGKQEPTLKVGNLTAERDFTDVRDVVVAYRLLLERGKVGEVYHVASGVAVSIQAILDMLLSYSTATIHVTEDPTRLRPSDTPIVVGDADKLKTATGWRPSVPLDQSLRDILAWWREREHA